MHTTAHVYPIDRSQAAPFILGIHYAKRWPSISFLYGLFVNSELVGVVSYGTPSSAPLRDGVAGSEYKNQILELNRLCLLNNKKNEASFLVSKSLAFLPKNRIIVSYADTEQGHVGYVYQACNFIYTGLSAKRTDWKVRGMEHLHGQTIGDKFRNTKGKRRVDTMREHYGESFYLKDRPRKHRYIYIVGSKTYKKHALKALRYPILAYPKNTLHP